MHEVKEVLFEQVQGKEGDLGLITLNRPKALNALSQQMCIDLYQQLRLWAEDVKIKAVIIRGNGKRAFCAGGDIRYFYEKKDSLDKSPEFFQHEYRLDHYIFHYPKPYISLLHGITMGGGAGISINGSHRVAAENLVFAMPETAIGFHPDIGAGYFLTRCLKKMGFYLALTGAKIDTATARYVGLIDAVVPEENFSKLINAIADAQFSINPKETVTDIIKQFSLLSSPMPFLDRQPTLDDCFSQNSVETIIAALRKIQQTWTEQIVHELMTKCPISLKVTLRKFHESHYMSFDDCIRMDYRLTQHFLQHQNFYEGIRAAVIDKDRKPKWQPATLAEVTEKDIDEYFMPLEQELVF